MGSGLFDGTGDWTDVGVTAGLVLAIAYGAAFLTGRAVRSLLKRLLGDRLDAADEEAVKRPVRLARSAMFISVSVVLGASALRLAGVPGLSSLTLESVTVWLVGTGVRILLISAAGFVTIRVVSVVVQRFEDQAGRGQGLEALERAKRARTLGRLIRNGASTLAVVVALLMILRELDMDITPLLAGAGILAFAVGFGSQALVRDLIAGFFMILEDQVRVGDIAVINGTSGLVEAITLRTIVLRDLEGTVHVFPNGGINTLANRTRDFSFYVIDVPVAYDEDTDRVVEVVRQTGDALQADPAFGANMLSGVEVLGVDAFDASQVTIKARIKTVPLKQWEVGREFRRRLKKAFDANGIEIPFPQLTLHVPKMAPVDSQPAAKGSP